MLFVCLFLVCLFIWFFSSLCNLISVMLELSQYFVRLTQCPDSMGCTNQTKYCGNRSADQRKSCKSKACYAF